MTQKKIDLSESIDLLKDSKDIYLNDKKTRKKNKKKNTIIIKIYSFSQKYKTLINTIRAFVNDEDLTSRTLVVVVSGQ